MFIGCAWRFSDVCTFLVRFFDLSRFRKRLSTVCNVSVSDVSLRFWCFCYVSHPFLGCVDISRTFKRLSWFLICCCRFSNVSDVSLPFLTGLNVDRRFLDCFGVSRMFLTFLVLFWRSDALLRCFCVAQLFCRRLSCFRICLSVSDISRLISDVYVGFWHFSTVCVTFLTFL